MLNRALRLPKAITRIVCIALLVVGVRVYGVMVFLPIAPSATTSGINTFNDPHRIYVDRTIVVEHNTNFPPERHQLLVFIPDTAKTTGLPDKSNYKHPDDDPSAFCIRAARSGYHVVVLSCVEGMSASVCAKDDNINAFEQFRAAIIQGGNSKYITVKRSESIEYRLINLIGYLAKIRSEENWKQFLNTDSTIKWESIAVAGQYEGGANAVLLAMKYPVARVICFGGPKDYDKKRNVPAEYYGKDFATPKDRFFVFYHSQDWEGGVSPEQFLSNLKALKLDKFGLPIDADKEVFPYHHTRILMTAYPNVKTTGSGSEGSMAAHTSTLSAKNADRLRKIWNYMLTEDGR